MIWLLCIGAIGYLLISVWVLVGIGRLPQLNIAEKPPVTRFTVVVPFRNEEVRITPLLESITRLKYPTSLYELIFVDDDSSDDGRDLIENWFEQQQNSKTFRIVDNEQSSGSPKKDAIQLAVKLSEMDWIASTDADCELPPNWLLNLDQQNRAGHLSCLAAGVKLTARTNVLEQLQLIELLGLQQFAKAGYGWGLPILSNGANLAYSREDFIAVNGFAGNDHLASGDDQFLVEKFNRNRPNSCHFISSADQLVTTNPETKWRSAINQRIRWASKQTRNGSSLTRMMGLMMFLINLMVPISLMWVAFGNLTWPIWAAFFGIKVLMDLLLIYQSNSLEREHLQAGFIPLVALIYPILMTLIGILSFRARFRWKDRTYRNQR